MSASLTQKLGKSLMQGRSASLATRSAKQVASSHSQVSATNYTQ